MKFLADKKFLVKMVVAVSMFLTVLLVNFLASNYIKNNFAEIVVSDIAWDNIPYLPIVWVSEIFLVLAIVYVIFWSFKVDKNYIPYYLVICFSFQIIRAFLIILTPLSLPYQYTGVFPIGKESMMSFGLFPSGHLAYPYMAYLITKSKFAILLTFLCGLALLISRGHYSIDLVGTIFIGFATYVYFNMRIKKYFVEEKPKND